MKTVVVDASVVLGYLIKSNKSAFAKFPKLLLRVKSGEFKIFSLSLLPLEVANGLRFSNAGMELAAGILLRFSNLPIKLLNLSDDLLHKTTNYAYQNKATVYDTAYHLLAISRNSTLWTCDRKYYLASRKLGHIELLS